MGIEHDVRKEMQSDYAIRKDVALTMDERICVVDKTELKFQILEEAYSMHTGATKM